MRKRTFTIGPESDRRLDAIMAALDLRSHSAALRKALAIAAAVLEAEAVYVRERPGAELVRLEVM
jgi:hypothetical protein